MALWSESDTNIARLIEPDGTLGLTMPIPRAVEHCMKNKGWTWEFAGSGVEIEPSKVAAEKIVEPDRALCRFCDGDGYRAASECDRCDGYGTDTRSASKRDLIDRFSIMAEDLEDTTFVAWTKAINNPGSATRKSVAADLRLAIELLETL